MATVLDSAVEAAFAGLSALRRSRIVHPKGVAYEAELRPLEEGPPTGAELFDDGPRSVIVRLSRSLGVPEALPDPCGVAIRASDSYGPGLHQDLLLVSSGSRPLARHALLPARGFADRPYSSLLPYRVGSELRIVLARALGGAPGPSFAELATGVAPPDFELGLAAPRGPGRAVARLALGERLPAELADAIRFAPSNSGGGLEPAGLLNALRPAAYRGSQRGRPSTTVA